MTFSDKTGDNGPKEYLREAFKNGALDVTTDYHTVLGFVRIFKCEAEARTAVASCQFLTPRERAVLEKYL